MNETILLTHKSILVGLGRLPQVFLSDSAKGLCHYIRGVTGDVLLSVISTGHA